MPQSTTTNDGITLVNPGTYVSPTVQPNQGNIATAGVITLVGEADEGPGFQDEADLSGSAFRPEQFGRIVQKYQSGRLVDAARAAIAAANDQAILGAVSLIRLVKTNRSLAASSTIARAGFGNYSAITSKRAGLPGNLTKYRSEAAAAETAPTTGEFAYCPATTGTTAFKLRTNGGSPKSISNTAKQAPDSLRDAMHDVALGILAIGGAQKLVLPTAALSLTATAPDTSTLVVTLQSGSLWANSPAVGDTAVIPANGDYGAAQDSSIAGAGNANVGSYIVQSVSNTASSAVLTLKRISSGTTVADTGVVSADLKDLILYAPLEIKNATGMDRGSIVGVAGTYNTTSNDGSQVTLALPSSTSFAAQPKAGDLMTIASTFAGTTAGFYQVLSATASTVTAVRLSAGSAGTTGSASVGSPPTLSNQPFHILKPVIDGLGKTLTIEGTVSAIFRSKSTTADAGLSNSQKISASEYKNQMTFSKGDLSEPLKAGGEIVLTIGCSEEDASMTIDDTGITVSVAATPRWSATFAQFKTMKDLVDYANSQTNFTAAVALAKFNSTAPAALDNGTFTISGLAAHKNGRIKKDAAEWSSVMNTSALVSVTLAADSGLPETQTPDQFLAGGSKAGSAAADFTTALDAAEKLDTNFIVPLIATDADEDIENEETESSSTYTVDAVNAYAKAHVLKMSAIKMRRNRIANCAKRAPYDEVKNAAAELASARVSLCFQDIKNVSTQGTTKQYQPWMASVIAAGMQSAAGFKGIVKKFANISGIISPFGDFDANNPGDTEDALSAGLMLLERVTRGGFRWISDQMTYSTDNNFVYNSLQAMYVADLVTLTLIDTFDRTIVGRSVAEISAAAALGVLENEMFNFKRLKWIAASDDAPKGFKNASANLRGPVMEIFCEIKLAGLIYFVPIYLNISQVEQTAT